MVIEEWDEQTKLDWELWLDARPAIVQQLARRFPPNHLYRMKSCDLRCTVYSYNEDGTMRVDVTGQFNRVLFSRQVFGVEPDDLEECDLPLPGEDLGDTSKEEGYSVDDVRNILIPEIRRRRKRESGNL